MKLKNLILPVVATLTGAQAVQAQQAPADTPIYSSAPTPDDVLIQLYQQTDAKLLSDGNLRISLKESMPQIEASGALQIPAEDKAAEEKAQLALDRSALPLIQSLIDPNAPVSTAQIDKAFNNLLDYFTAHTKNIATTVQNLERAGMADQALIYAMADDIKQGGTIAGYFNRMGDPAAKRMAVIDHYTGMEAGQIMEAAGMDMRIRNGIGMPKSNFKKGTMNIPGYYLRQEEIKKGAAYSYRNDAATLVTSKKTPGSQSSLLTPLWWNYQRPYAYGTKLLENNYHNTPGYNFSVSFARDLFLPIAAERLRQIPPEPVAPPPAQAKPQPRTLRR